MRLERSGDNLVLSILTVNPAERSVDECDQGVREQQVEGHRAEGWQACKGMRAVCQGAFSR